MSVKDCIIQAKDFLKASSLKMSDVDLMAYAKKMEAIGGTGMTKAQYAAALTKMMDERALGLEDLRVEKAMNAADSSQSVKKIFNPSKGEGAAQNALNYITGGGVKPGEGNKVDPAEIKGQILSDLHQTFDHLFTKYKNIGKNSTMLRDVYRELWELDGGTPGKTGNRIALEIAQGIKKFNDIRFQLEKANNPRMEKLIHWLVKNTHDQELVAKDPSGWVGLHEKLAPDSFPEVTDPTERHNIWVGISHDIIDGTYGTLKDNEEANFERTSRGPNKRAQMARARIINYSSADAAFEAHSRFGKGNIFDVMNSMVSRTASNLSTMQKFTSDPEGWLRTIEGHGNRTLRGDALKEWKDQKDLRRQAFVTATGQADAPASNLKGRSASGLTQVIAAGKIGLALPHAWKDLGNGIARIRSATGATIGSNIHSFIGDYAQFMAPGGRARMEDVLLKTGLGVKAMHQFVMGDLGARTDKMGYLGSAVQFVAKWSGLQRHIDATRATLGLLLGNGIAEHSHLGWDAIPDKLRDGLLSNDIGRNRWEAIRQAKGPLAGLNHAITGAPYQFISQDMIHSLPDELIENMLLKEHRDNGGIEAFGKDGSYSPDQIYKGRKDLAYSWGAMVSAHADASVIHLNTSQKAFAYRGLTVNDGWGAILRLFWQFKAPLISELDTMKQVARTGEGGKTDYAGVAQFMALNLMFGVIGNEAVNQVTGRKEDYDSAEFWAKSLLSTSGLGIMTDILFNEMHKKDPAARVKTAMTSVAGPGLSLPFQLSSDIGGAIQGGRHRFRPLLNTVGGLVPGQNLLPVKSLLHLYLGDEVKKLNGNNGILNHIVEGNLHP